MSKGNGQAPHPAQLREIDCEVCSGVLFDRVACVIIKVDRLAPGASAPEFHPRERLKCSNCGKPMLLDLRLKSEPPRIET